MSANFLPMTDCDINIVHNDIGAHVVKTCPQLLNRIMMDEIFLFHSSLPGYAPTPLHELKCLAQSLGLASLMVKDESFRFGQNSFKALGASWAAARAARGKNIKNLVLATATDGNHGRGVAWAAKNLGCGAIVMMPKGSSFHRTQAIRNLGAQCEITTENYDRAVEMLAEKAKMSGWTTIQDTSCGDDETIPLEIMRGYGTLILETYRQIAAQNLQAPTHVFLQAGVGSFAAAVIGAIQVVAGGDLPKFIIVEPENANCVYRSILRQQPQIVEGELQTIMAGLACGRVNPLAWPVLQENVCAAFSCPDWIAANGMRIYSSPLGGDARIISGESGAVTMGILQWLFWGEKSGEMLEMLEIDNNSRILLINTEGDTDPEAYKKIIWHGAHATPESMMPKRS